MDTWGPYHTQSYCGARYFLTIVDDYNRVTWTHLLYSRRYAFTLIKAFITMVKTQFQLPIKVIRSDNALELGSSNSTLQFFFETRIIHQTTCPHTPQQNGVVERKHKHLLETSRALLFQSKLPTKFWGDCILTATYPINRFPSSVLSNKAPFEVLLAVHLHTHLKLRLASGPVQARDRGPNGPGPYGPVLVGLGRSYALGPLSPGPFGPPRTGPAKRSQRLYLNIFFF